MNQIKFII